MSYPRAGLLFYLNNAKLEQGTIVASTTFVKNRTKGSLQSVIILSILIPSCTMKDIPADVCATQTVFPQAT